MKVTFLVIIFLMAQAAVAAPADETPSEQAKLQAIQQELKESKEKLKQAKLQQQEALGKLVGINQDLKSANRKLKQAKERIQVNKSKIGELTVELRRTEQDLRQKASLLEKRVRESYKSSSFNNLELILAAGSMSDFFNRLYYFEKVLAQDQSLIRGIKGDMRVVKNRREVLADRTAEIKELAQVIALKKEKIAEQAEEKKQVIAELKERAKEYEHKIAELERSSQELSIVIQKKVAERSRAGLVARGSGVLSWPLRGRLTSRFGAIRRWGGGYRHTGVDIAAPHGTPITAADGGEVIFSGWWDGYGKALVVDHGKGRTTVYGHLSRIYLQVGNAVAKGQTVGLVGSTGYSTGPHLHFEVRINGTPVNPMPYLPK